jgi:hypothetical protein
MAKLIVAFRNFSNTPKNDYDIMPAPRASIRKVNMKDTSNRKPFTYKCQAGFYEESTLMRCYVVSTGI